MSTDSIRRASTALLGNKYRLEVAGAIARAKGAPITCTTVSDETGIRYPRVQEELKRLNDAGVLRAKAAPPGQPVEYKAQPTAYWDLCAALLDELGSSGL